MFFVSHDASCTERIKDYLDETSTDNTDLMTSLQSTTNTNSKVGINALSVEQVAQRMVPGMDAQTASSSEWPLQSSRNLPRTSPHTTRAIRPRLCYALINVLSSACLNVQTCSGTRSRPATVA